MVALFVQLVLKQQCSSRALALFIFSSILKQSMMGRDQMLASYFKRETPGNSQALNTTKHFRTCTSITFSLQFKSTRLHF